MDNSTQSWQIDFKGFSMLQNIYLFSNIKINLRSKVYAEGSI